MSAIFGFYHRREGPSVEVEENAAPLRRMSDAMPTRGSDAIDFYSSGVVGLGCRMRWTTPESLHETLPLTDKTGRYTLTACARIDNRDELIAELEIGRPASGVITDCDIILASYAAWGERCAEHLLGDFAFAVWDAQEQSLYLARDHFGVQPLVYAAADGVFAFATDMAALRCFAVDREGSRAEERASGINEEEVAAFLAHMDLQPAQTFYSGILRLPAAHCMTVTASQMEIRRYWRLDPKRAHPPASDAEYAAKLREIFSEAVRCRMRSLGDVGSMLSGGIDSTSIACVAARIASQQGSQPLPTYSAVVSGEGTAQERDYVDAALQTGAFRPSFLSLDQIDPYDDLAGMVSAVEGLFVPGNLYINWNIYKMAAHDGVSVMLEGVDGDNAIGHGTGYFRELAATGKWLTLAVQLRGYTKYITYEPFWPVYRSWLKRFTVDKWTAKIPPLQAIRARRAAARAAALETEAQGQPKARDRKFENGKARVNPRLHPTLRERAAPNPPRAHETERERHVATLTEFDQALAFEMLGKVGAVYGIEPRFPFMDVRLIEFCVALPADQKMRSGVTRFIMRNAMQGILPDAVRTRRTKGSYDRVFVEGLKNGKADADAFQDALTTAGAFINADRAAKLAHQLFSGQEPTSEEALEVWHGFCIYEWMKQVCNQDAMNCISVQTYK